MQFSIRSIVHNVPRLPNSLAKYWGGQSLWTHLYKLQLAYSHWQHSPIRATTQGSLVFICHSEHNSRDVIPSHNSMNVTCLLTIPSHNSRDIIPSQNLRNTSASQSLRYHLKSCRPCTSKTYKHFVSTLLPVVA